MLFTLRLSPIITSLGRNLLLASTLSIWDRQTFPLFRCCFFFFFFVLFNFFFIFIFELQVEFLLGDFHEIRMTEYPLFWESFLHLNDRCSSWTELAVNRNRKS